jgi:hypothetical protein
MASLNKKNCSACVYGKVCVDRKDLPSIQDCCVPEEPLRRIQQNAMSWKSFIQETRDYVKEVKSKSKYWSQFI